MASAIWRIPGQKVRRGNNEISLIDSFRSPVRVEAHGARPNPIILHLSHRCLLANAIRQIMASAQTEGTGTAAIVRLVILACEPSTTPPVPGNNVTLES